MHSRSSHFPAHFQPHLTQLEAHFPHFQFSGIAWQIAFEVFHMDIDLITKWISLPAKSRIRSLISPKSGQQFAYELAKSFYVSVCPPAVCPFE